MPFEIAFPFVLDAVLGNIGAITTDSIPSTLWLQPVFLAYGAIVLLCSFGLVGYVAARIANRSFILHGVLTAVIIITLGIILNGVTKETFSALVTMVIFGLAMACLGAAIRMLQVNRRMTGRGDR